MTHGKRVAALLARVPGTAGGAATPPTVAFPEPASWDKTLGPTAAAGRRPGYGIRGRATGSYDVTRTYQRAGQIRTRTYPSIGGPPAETVTLPLESDVDDASPG